MENVNHTGKGRTAVFVLVILATFMLVAFLVMEMVRIAGPAPVGDERNLARARDNAEIRAAGNQALMNWGYVDQPRGIVRLPIEDAMKLTVQGYANSPAFHSDLVARVEKATAPPPKPVNPFE